MRNLEVLLELVGKIEALYERLLFMSERCKCGFEVPEVKAPRIEFDSVDEIMEDLVKAEYEVAKEVVASIPPKEERGWEPTLIVNGCEVKEQPLPAAEPAEPVKKLSNQEHGRMSHKKCVRCNLPKPGRWLDAEGVCTSCHKVAVIPDRPFVGNEKVAVNIPERDFDVKQQPQPKACNNIQELYAELLIHFKDTSTFSIDTVASFARCGLPQARAFMEEMVLKQAAQRIGESDRYRLKVRSTMDSYWGTTMPSVERKSNVEF